MPHFIGEVLMMLDAPMSLLNRVEAFQFVQNSGGQSRVHQIFGVTGDGTGAIDLHATPLPTTKPKNLLVELIRKALGPCCIFFAKIVVENLLQGLAVADFLVSSGFVDQGCNTNDLKTL